MSAGDSRLLVVTPLRIEEAAVRCALPGALLLRCGMGAARARAAVPVIAQLRAGAVAVAGLCGALDGGLRAGDVLVASQVRGPDGVAACSSAPLVAALAAVGVRRVHVGPILSVDHLVHGAERAALAGDGAAATGESDGSRRRRAACRRRRGPGRSCRSRGSRGHWPQ